MGIPRSTPKQLRLSAKAVAARWPNLDATNAPIVNAERLAQAALAVQNIYKRKESPPSLDLGGLTGSSERGAPGRTRDG